MKLHNLTLKIAAIVMLSASAAYAASDGTLGLTSTGTTNISITKGDQALITKLTDINLGAWTAGAVTGVSNACVYTTTGGYSVTATSANVGATSTFRLFNGTAGYITYTVQWQDNGGTYDPTAYNTALIGQAGDNTAQDCGGAAATNAKVQVNITNAQMTAAANGVYTDTLTLLITPL